jgi:hypothetical protein
MLFRKKYKIDEKIRGRLLNRLRNTSDAELLRWIENVHVGIARDIDSMRKSLTHGQSDQALVYIEDTRTGAVSLLAAMQVLEEKFNLQN